MFRPSWLQLFGYSEMVIMIFHQMDPSLDRLVPRRVLFCLTGGLDKASLVRSEQLKAQRAATTFWSLFSSICCR